MTNSRNRKLDAMRARAQAEDRAVVYLDKLPPQVAYATAVRVEWSLATKWAAEQEEMRRRKDPRDVVPIALDDFRWLIDALSAIPPGLQINAAAEQHIIDLLKDFSSDWAWWTARKVTRWAEVEARMKGTELSAHSAGGRPS